MKGGDHIEVEIYFPEWLWEDLQALAEKRGIHVEELNREQTQREVLRDEEAALGEDDPEQEETGPTDDFEAGSEDPGYSEEDEPEPEESEDEEQTEGPVMGR